MAIGKGVQDLVFFLVESFDLADLPLVVPLLKSYYYIQLCEHGVSGYSYEEYCADFALALKHFPMFVSLWFGTVPMDELIDKNFPYFFIRKAFAALLLV